MSRKLKKSKAIVSSKASVVESSVESPNSTKPQNPIKYLKANWLIILSIGFFCVGALGAGLKYLEDDAKRQMAQGANPRVSKGETEESFLNSINPFLPATLPNPTPQLSKELIYSGSKLISVIDANATDAPPADLAIWRPSSGEWWVMGGAGSQQVTQAWGINGDTPVPGDYDGDGKTDFSIFRPSNGNWYFIYSAGGGGQIPFGQNGDKEAQADYDGDGKTDAAVFRPDTTANTGTWYVSRSSDGGTSVQAFGFSSDTPVPADFDGDGRADIAVFRSSEARFYILKSSTSQLQTIIFGQIGDKPVPGDYDGDGKADAAVWRGGVYQWHILYSSTGTTEGFTFGDPQTDKYVQNDYDGDGKVDRAFWRPSTGIWHIVQSSKRGQPDEVRTVQWGIAGDFPVPAYYRR